MAGGMGARLWPISRESCPKQFIKLLGSTSLFQLTLERNKIFGRPLVITTTEYHHIAKEQAEELGINVDFVVEPTGRNTAPCALVAAVCTSPEDIIILLPSDHHIENTEQYAQSIFCAIKEAQDGNIVTFGIEPYNIHTGYGYIRSICGDLGNAQKVTQFTEKPSMSEAYEYIMEGDCYWNSGIFVFRSESIIDLAIEVEPDMYNMVVKAMAGSMYEGQDIFLCEEYDNIKANSIDCAFIEKASNLLMIKANFGWRDLGGWQSLWDMHGKDSVGNTTLGNVEIYDTTNSYVQSEGKLTAVIGVNDIIVVNTPEASLVVHKSRADDIKHLLEEIRSKKSTAESLEN